jgi:hypothetical protein
MKKTIQKKKLQLSKSTVRQLSPSDTSRAHGAIINYTVGCPTVTCNCYTRYTCSCKHSVCDSCYNTDCCLMEP